jgi:hypothetical protein
MFKHQSMGLDACTLQVMPHYEQGMIERVVDERFGRDYNESFGLESGRDRRGLCPIQWELAADND